MRREFPLTTTLLCLALLLATAAASQAPEGLEAQRTRYAAAVAADPGDYTAQWNLARVLVDLGNRQEGDARKSMYEDAVKHARAAVALNPDDTWGHCYLSEAVGKLALAVGGKRKIELSKEVRDEAEKAIACDPDNDRAHHILGRWNREVAHLSPILKLAAKVVYGGVPKGASDEKAVAEFREAIRINPTHINHHLELGITLMGMKRYQEALKELQTALDLPDSDPNDPHYKDEARENIRLCEKKIERRQERRQH